MKLYLLKMKKFFHYVILMLFIIACNSYGEKLTFKGTDVYYTESISKDEAEKLGNYLVSSKFADGKEKSVQITKDETSGNFVFRMVTKPEAAKDSTYNFIFKFMAMQLSDSVFNKAKVDFHVCDNTFKTLKVISYE